MEERIKEILKRIKLNESMLSMLLGVVTIVVVGVLIFNFYRQTRTAEITEEAESTEAPTEMIGEVPVVEKEDGKKFPAELKETYIVQEGDHLWKIAEKNYGSGYNWVDIAEENNIANPNVLLVGQEIRLPDVPVITIEEPVDPAYTLKPGQETIEESSYTVVEGDTLWDISVRAYQDGYRWTEIAKVNEIVNPNYIEVGQVIELPRGK